MIGSHPPTSPYGIDNPWPRLPGVLLTSLLFWGALLWGFGLLLRQQSEGPPRPKPVDMQFMELPEPPQQARPAGPPRPDILARAPGPATKPRRETTQTKRVGAARPSSQPRPAALAPAAPAPANAAAPEMDSAAEDTHALTHPGQSDTIGDAGISPDAPEESGPSPESSGAAYLRNPKPAYPARAKRMGLEGTVLLNVLVGREGKTLRTEVAQSSGHGILDEAAAEAVRSWKFIPARRGNALLETWVQVPISFRLTR